MDLRPGLFELTARHGLDAEAARRLHRLAGLDAEPEALARWWPRALAALGAALGGFGLLLWIAANWDSLGRAPRFALLQAAVVVMALGALSRPAARAPLGLLALLGIGGLFAFFGQTYQTGADPWQLFALWAALALPLCLGVRSEMLWAPWALVAMTAVALWLHAHVGHRWSAAPDNLLAHALAWCAAALLVAGLGPTLRRATGAGPWALRSALTLAVVMVTTSALIGLFARPVAPQFVCALLLLGAAAGLFATRAAFDVYALSAVALGFDSLLVCGLARALFDEHHGDPIGALFIDGVAAAALLAASVSAILRLARRRVLASPA